jgi:hypothetical protein
MKSKFFGSIDSANGQRIFTPNGNTKRFLGQLGKPENQYAEQTVSRVTDSARARGAAMLRTMDLPPELRVTVVRAQRSAAALDKTIEAAKAAAIDGREIQALKAREAHSGGHGLLGGLAAHAIGGPVGTGLYSAGKVIYNIAKNPVKTLEWISQFRKADKAVKGHIAEQSASFLKGERVPAVKGSIGEADKKAALQSIADVRRYTAEPRNLAMAIKDSVGDMVEHTPRLATALASTMARGVLALSKRAPVPLPPRFSDKPGEERYASGALEKYWRDKQLVERPQTVLQLMRTGQLHQEDIQLMQEVVPRIFSQMQTQMEMDLMDAKKKGDLRHFPYQEQIALSWMLGRPLDGTQTAEFISAMQQSAASDPSNQGAMGKAAEGGGRPSKLNNINMERYETLQERLEAS